MKKGDLLRNKSDGKFAMIVRDPWVSFFPDDNQCDEFDSGVADTAIRIRWVEDGYEKTYQQSKLRHNWDIVSESNC